MDAKSSHFTHGSQHPVVKAALGATGVTQRSRLGPTLFLRIIWPLVKPHSVGEFGCLYATWLHAAKQLGAKRIHGFDLPEVDLSSRHLTEDQFTGCDLTVPIELPDRFDLAVSTEVGEHLPLAGAATFVDNLTRASDCVLFGSAAPFSGGVNHINENWLEFWANLFAERDYVCYDILRMRLWHDTRAPYYYRQNTVVYVKAGRDAAFRKAGHAPTKRPATLIHPEHFLKAVSRKPIDMPIVKASVRDFYEASAVAKARSAGRAD